MRFHFLSLVTLLNALTVLSLLIPREATDLIVRDARVSDLFKRKGGGGGGKGGGSSSSSSSSGSSSSSSGGSTSGSSSSASGARSGTGSTSASPSYGGGRYYGGGSTTPYAAGSTSTRGLGSRGLLPIAALGFFGGAWLAGAYLYSYPRPYGFYNTSAMQNQTRPVVCLCQQYNPCGCDDSDDDGYLNSVIGNGSYNSLNPMLVRVSDINGTTTIALNGTLPNSTTTTSAAPAGPAGSAGFGWVAIAAALSAALWVL